MSRRVNAALAALCIALAIGLLTVLFSPPHGGSARQPSIASETNQKSHSLVIRFWRWTTHDAVAFYTSLLAAFTFVLAISTIGLWLVTYFTLRHARNEAARQAEDMRNSIAAAVHSADAGRAAAVEAQKSNLLASDIARRQLRAYVFLERAEVVSNGLTLGATLIFRNSGQTPAYDVKVYSQMAVTPKDDPPQTLTTDAAVPFGHVNIGPGGSFAPPRGAHAPFREK